jgi:hypothetical protein
MKFYLLFFLFALISSCTKNNDSPSWIYIDSWELQPNKTNKEGILTQNFTNAYVLIDDKIIGYFELPITLPILSDGAKKIEIYPAILNNGISATKKYYPFCEAYKINVTLSRNQTITIKPTTRYYSNTQFWIEDFEDAGLKIETDDNYPEIFSIDNNDNILKYGSRYGHIHLTKKDSAWVGYTNSKLALPKNAAEVYLEIDYMNTNSLLTGVISYGINGTKTNPNIQLNSQKNKPYVWKKIYIDLKEIVSSSNSANYFEQYFKAELESGLTESDIYIDNIKLVYF